MSHPGQAYAPPPPTPGQAVPGHAPGPVPGHATHSRAGSSPTHPGAGRGTSTRSNTRASTDASTSSTPHSRRGDGTSSGRHSRRGASAGSQRHLRCIIRTMVAAALSDGFMAPEEKTSIQGRLAESGLDEDKTRSSNPPRPSAAAVPGRARQAWPTTWSCAKPSTVSPRWSSSQTRRSTIWSVVGSIVFVRLSRSPPSARQALEAETLGAVQGDV